MSLRRRKETPNMQKNEEEAYEGLSPDYVDGSKIKCRREMAWKI